MAYGREGHANAPEKAYKALPLEDRLALALREHLSPEERRFILHHEQWMQVRCYFARRADLSAAEVAVLLADDDHVIRLCIAKRPDLSPEQLALCASDRDPNVRYFAARNPALPETLRAALLNDQDPLVQRAARKGPKAARVVARAGQAPLIRS